MSLAFYAPLKSPDHPTPSGDRRMARALMDALARTGQRVEIACRLRSYDRTGDLLRQQRLQALGDRCAERLLRRYRQGQEPPQAWLTYHGYHKAPDWLGPEVSAALEHPLSHDRGLVRAQAAGRPLGLWGIAPPSGRCGGRTS